MLFDLRSRGRRRTVQAVYLGLAILMAGGLILFGVGTGSGLGGLLNAFTGSGSGNNGSQISSEVSAALKQVKADPNSSAAWAQLVRARYQNASTNGYDQATATYTAAGKRDLLAATVAYQRYLALAKNPDPNVALLAAHAYGKLGDYAQQATAWQVQASAYPNQVKSFECLALSAYAAGQTRLGGLATAKALALVSPSARKNLKAQLTAAQTNPSIAAVC